MKYSARKKKWQLFQQKGPHVRFVLLVYQKMSEYFNKKSTKNLSYCEKTFF